MNLAEVFVPENKGVRWGKPVLIAGGVVWIIRPLKKTPDNPYQDPVADYFADGHKDKEPVSADVSHPSPNG